MVDNTLKAASFEDEDKRLFEMRCNEIFNEIKYLNQQLKRKHFLQLLCISGKMCKFYYSTLYTILRIYT